MTIEELRQNIAFLFAGENPVGIKLFFVIEENGEVFIRFADISDEVATDLIQQFTTYIQNTLVNNPDLNYGSITEADASDNSAYYYDLGGQPDQLHALYEVNAEEIFTLSSNTEQPFQNFSFTADDLTSIKGFVICLGNEANKVLLYKKHYPVSLMRRGTYYGLIPSTTRFERFTNNIIKINESVEFLLINDELIVLNLKTFQNSFGFDQIIRTKAGENLTTIGEANLLDDIEVLRELSTELKYAKKLMSIKHDSPVLHIPFPNIVAFVRNHPKLRRRIRFNDEETRIVLRSRASKELFIKILNDDFLKSELTQLLYDSQKKSALDNVEINDATEE